MRTFPKIALCFAVASILGCASVAQASIESRPFPMRTQAPVKDVALTLVFSGRVNLRASAVKISDVNGNRVHTGELRYGPDDKDVEIPLAGALRPGVYSISWHAVSVDGQDSVGGYDFTIDAVGQQVPAIAQQ